MTTYQPIRDLEQISQDWPLKLRVVQIIDYYQAIHGTCSVRIGHRNAQSNWLRYRAVACLVDATARLSSKRASAHWSDYISNIYGVASVAKLGRDEVDYRVSKMAVTKRL